MMEYKGYFAKVEFDDQANIFHGEIINLRDVITFEGETVDEWRIRTKSAPCSGSNRPVIPIQIGHPFNELRVVG